MHFAGTELIQYTNPEDFLPSLFDLETEEDDPDFLTSPIAAQSTSTFSDSKQHKPKATATNVPQEEVDWHGMQYECKHNSVSYIQHNAASATYII